jgi:hypothetical protein
MHEDIKSALCSRLDDNFNFRDSSNYNITGWDYWQDNFYPRVIKTEYPVYIQERAQDKGKQAYEIIKQLKDKKLIKLDTVGDFIEAMDCLIKIL